MDAAQGLEAVHPGHHHVKQDNIRHIFAHPLEGFAPVGGGSYAHAFEFKVEAHEVYHARFIINYKYEFIFQF